MTGRERFFDEYELLGVSEFAPDEVINAAWRVLVRDIHPDKALDEADRRQREARAVELNNARDALLDPHQRAAIDRDRTEYRARAALEAEAARRRRQAERDAGMGDGSIPPQRPTTPAPVRALPLSRRRRARRWLRRRLLPHLRFIVVPWFTYSRLGQWLVVVGVGLVAYFVAQTFPDLGYVPGQAFVIGFVVSGLVLAIASRSLWGTPLGDTISVAIALFNLFVELVRGFGSLW